MTGYGMDEAMGIKETAGFVLMGGIGVVYWLIYPYTLSRAALFSTSPLSYWIGRILFAVFGPYITIFAVLLLVKAWMAP